MISDFTEWLRLRDRQVVSSNIRFVVVCPLIAAALGVMVIVGSKVNPIIGKTQQ